MPPRGRKKTTSVPPHVAEQLDDDVVGIYPVHPEDHATIAALLLKAGEPGQVRTVTTPKGFLVPKTTATTAGFGEDTPN